MEQNQEPRNKLKNNILLGCPRILNGEKTVFSIMVLGYSDIHMQSNKTEPITYATQKN